MQEQIKVSSKSNPKSVAGFITNKIKDGKPVEIITIGAAALNQAIKGLSIAKQYLSKSLCCEADFVNYPDL
ncbi:stage V sporulation protein S [Bacteroides sp.]|uniref:stage V sporulation protein S n=1 Tax=Bacteroides sp. TaxID=29523 RepID=UPI002634B064|nr:stage V sporulation protein S [Bacteroides sp.]MDD3040393.1 stage V sporulation protein S [Bacteroides sp.]